MERNGSKLAGKTMAQDSVTILQHAKNEGGGLFEEIAREKGFEVRYLSLCEAGELPPVTSTHLLVLGGPMSVNDEKEFSWLKQEKQLIREWVAGGRPVLGICLGAQLIASAHGAAVRPCEPEIGWSFITGIKRDFLPAIPPTFPVFQMHGETFDLPGGAELVFCGEKVKNQGLCIGSALGLQFHVEITANMVRDWVGDRNPEEQAHHIDMTAKYLPASNRVCRLIAERFLSAPETRFSWR
jgi:GMP synthase-like glutamine amidotransferase